MMQVVTIQPGHFAVRIRFGVYFFENDNINYTYPLAYAMDGVAYNYSMAALPYFGCYDIVTSPLQSHYMSNVTIAFVNTGPGIPNNNDHGGGNGCENGCQCSNGLGCCINNNCPESNCCDNRYIQITDLIVFVSLCPSNCLICTSSNICL